MSSPTGEAPHGASSSHSPEQAANAFLRRLPRACRLLVAFSGGGDSTGLLVALKTAQRAFPGISLQAATVDHGLRAGSAEEAAAASRFCQGLGVPHAILRWSDDKPTAAIQASARAARYRLLATEAERIDADLIVTAHNREDQEETMAMRRARDPATIEGMDEAVLVERRIWAVRPFLRVKRQAIRDDLRAQGFVWSEDPSNTNLAFERVRVRLSGQANAPGIGDGPAQRYEQATCFLRDHVKVHSGIVASVDLGALDVKSPGHRAALLTLAAVLGGREHLSGREAADRIFAALATGAAFRMTASRVVFDRRKDRLYLCREARGLPDLIVPPAGIACWDGRFEIGNQGLVAARIVAGSALPGGKPLFALEGSGELPKGVARLAEATMPRLAAGNAQEIRVRPVLAPFEHFLTRRKLDLANSLAAMVGLEHFPSLLLGDGSF